MNEILLERRKAAAANAKHIKCYLMTLTRLDRTSSVAKTEPLGQMTLASYLLMLGWDVQVMSGSIFTGFNYLKQHREDNKDRKVVVGLYVDYENLNAAASLSKQIKAALGYTIVLGGPQTVALNEAFLRKNPGVDAFLRGDGEYMVADVLDAIGRNDFDALAHIPGVSTISHGEYIDNGYAEPLSDMDEAPLFRSDCLINQFDRKAFVALSGRGCPFSCSFCFEGGNSKRVRLRSVGHMMRELEQRLKDHPNTRYIYFGDDTFTLQPERLQQFCAALKALREKHDFVWFVDGHVAVLLKHPEYVRMMVDAGMVRMQIGIESTCQPIIDIYNKHIRREDLYAVVDLCRQAGLPQLAGNIIIGGAMETLESARSTFNTIYDLLRRSKGMLDVTSTLYSHFPGTAMHADPKRFGMNIEDGEGLTSFGDYPIASTETLDRETIAALRREFILNCSRVMRECIAKNEADDRVLYTNIRLFNHYGIESMWLRLGMTNNMRRFYDYGAAYGTEQLRDDVIPLRTVFFHGEREYTKALPKVDGYVLSPLEDEMYRLCAGKLTCRQICERMRANWAGHFTDASAMDAFVYERLYALRKRRLMIFTELDHKRGEADMAEAEMTKASAAGTGTEATGRTEASAAGTGTVAAGRTEASGKQQQPGRMLLFYPYMIAGGIHIHHARHTLGVFILAAALKQNGFDAGACECTVSDVMELIRRENDGSLLAIGLSIDYENRRAVLALSKMIHETFGLKVIIGGVDARTITAEELASSKATAVIKGEGEITLPKLVKALKDGTALQEITGLLLFENGLKDTGAEEPMLDLDRCPLPDYSASLIKNDETQFVVMTGRGCPNHCAYCHEGTLHTKLRLRSIPNVLREIEGLLQSYPKLNYLLFADDTLVLRPERVLELCKGIKELKKKYHDFGWYCEADILSLDRYPEILPALIDAGITRLQVGIESGDNEMLKIYEKNLNPEMTLRVVKRCRDLGLPQLVGPILIGAPFENAEHVEREKAWLEKLLTIGGCMIEVPIAIISPYSQTPIGQNPERYGYVFTDAAGDCSNTDFPAYHTAQMSEKEILGAYHELTVHEVSVARRLIEAGQIPEEMLIQCMKMKVKYDNDGFWLRVINHMYPILDSYLEMRVRTGVPRLNDLSDEELSDWHVQRTLEIWRFVNFTEFGPTIGKAVLSPYEFQVLLYCAGKLSIAEMVPLLLPKFGMNQGQDEMYKRIVATVKDFERKHWVVAVPF